MNAPFLWIGFPGITAVVLLLFLDYPRVVKWTGTAAAGVLGLSALIIPVEKVINLLTYQVTLQNTMNILGRQLIILDSYRPLLVFLFWGYGVWFLLTDFRSVSPWMIPLGLLSLCFVLIILTVDPIFYAAIFFAFLALVNTILLTPPPDPAVRGVLRYLIYQIFGVLFMLFGMWMLSWVDVGTAERVLIIRAVIILGIGFSFLLAVFPFTSWIPMLAAENHPFLAAFVFHTYLTAVFLFGLRFLAGAGWLPTMVAIQPVLQSGGLLMVVLGGTAAVFSDHLGRTVSSAVIVEVGRSLVIISFFGEGFQLIYPQLMIQGVSLALWALCLTVLFPVVKDFRYRSLRGVAKQWPLIFGGLTVTQFSLAGLPLLAGFPIYWSAASSLVNLSPERSLIFLGGNLGLMIAAIRSTNYMVSSSDEEKVLILSNPVINGLIGVGIAGLIILGLFPQVLDPYISALVSGFRLP